MQPSTETAGVPQTALILFLSLAPFAVTTDFSMIGIVLPRIGAEFNMGSAALSGLVAINALVYAALLMAAGRMADLLGQRFSCTAGLVVFALGTLLVMLSMSFPVLLGARALQGAGAALISPATFSLINTAVREGPNRRRAYRMFGSFQGASMIAGPVLGGWLTTEFGWRSAYLLELCVAVVLLASIRRIVPEPGARTGTGGFDWAGAVLIAAGITMFVAAVSGIGGIPLSSLQRSTAAALAVLIFLALAQVERKSASPLLPPSVIRHPRVLTSSIGMAAAMAASTAFFLLPNVIMQQVLGWSAAAAGLGMLPHACAAMLAGQATGPLMGRQSLPRNISLAFGIIIAALLLYAWLRQPLSYAGSVLIPMLLGGFGSLLALMMMMADGAASVQVHEQGVFSALAYTSQQIGIAVGSAVLLSAAGTAANGTLIAALREAFCIAAAIAAIGLCVAVGLRQLQGRDTAQAG
ncbi:MAG TPA: MFS transporter [Steroidobacteraceae bacterium]|jgi:predicted MFS family arabinose efflux permease|nr:MFS transporter [Steroidobacteraceae bacterium]